MALSKIFLLICLCLGYVHCQITSKDGTSPVVTTKDGELRGTVLKSRASRDYFGFLGIRFGHVPARFEASQPTGTWEGLKDATEFGSECPQVELALQQRIFVKSEDCLHLNVYVPKLEKYESLPVMVWIHGGGFVEGAGSQYGADYLMDEDVILVTFNYRLGILGFLNTGDGYITGNNGLRDQILALKWVQRNIKNFHGDPNRVTIFGESAGAGFVHALVLSPLAKGLFHGAIAESGSMLSPWSMTEKPEQWATALAESANCPSTSSEEMISCLRKTAVAELLAVQKKMTNLAPDHVECRFGPTVDSVAEGAALNEGVLPSTPYELIVKGEGSKVPFIIGLNEAEGYMSGAGVLLVVKELMANLNDNWDTWSPTVFQYGGYVPLKDQEAFGQRLRQIYIGDKTAFSAETELSLVDLYTQINFYRGTRLSAELHSQSNPNIFPYIFTQRGKYSIAGLLGLNDRAPTHTDELQYLFKSLKEPSTGWPGPALERDEDVEFSKKFIKVWTSFAAHGKPSNALGLDWEPAKPDQPLGSPLPWYGINLKPQEYRFSPEREEQYVNLDKLYASYERVQVTWRAAEPKDEL